MFFVVLLALLLMPNVVWAGTSAQVALLSDYTFNGVTQTNGGAAWQVSVEHEQDSGVYFGTWVSNVDFGDRNQFETDTYVGYRWSNELADFDVGVVNYVYFGDSMLSHADYHEYYMGGSFQTNHYVMLRCSFDYPVTGADGNYDGHASHCITNYSYSLAEPIQGFDSSIHLNYSSSLDGEFSPWGNKRQYLHTKLSFSRTFDDFTFTVDFENTWGNDNISGGGFRTVLGIAHSFELQ